MSTCAHMNFRAAVEVNRLAGTDGAITGYSADIRITCEECGLPFEFLGLEAGLDLQGARVSIDGQEARLAITPKGARPNPLQRMAFNIRGFSA